MNYTAVVENVCYVNVATGQQEAAEFLVKFLIDGVVVLEDYFRDCLAALKHARSWEFQV